MAKNKLTKKELEALKEINRTKRHSTDFKSTYNTTQNTAPRQSFSSPTLDQGKGKVDRDQRRLDALNKIKVNQTRLAGDEEKEDKRNKWILILLLLLFLILVVIAVYYFMKNVKEVVYGDDVRMSMQIDNKDILTTISSTGQKVAKPVFPGDTISLRATARNANNFYGDTLGKDEGQPQNIYLRYRIGLEIDGVTYYDMLGVKFESKTWYRFDSSRDTGTDDNYYYCRNKVGFNNTETLFTGIVFIGDNFGYDLGGKYCKLVVSVEAIQADKAIISEAWATAPRSWVTEMEGK